MTRKFVAGLAVLLTITSGEPVLAAEPQLSACTVSPSTLSALDTDVTEAGRAAAGELNASVRQRVSAVAGAGAAKERIADQLRRGLIGTMSDGVTVTVVTTPEFKDSSKLRDARTRVKAGCFSAETLIAADDLLAARSWHPDAARAAFSYSLRATDSRYHVNFDSRYPEAAKKLAELLGNRGVVEMGETFRAGRTDDGRLHYGASGIHDDNSNFNSCTTGFVYYRNGVRGGMTAGHCFENGHGIWSGPNFWGWTFNKHNFPNYDMLAIEGDGSAYTNVIHSDACCPVKRTVVGRDPAWVGQSVCFSGMTTRAICSIQVTSVNGMFCDPLGCTGGLIETVRGGGVLYRAGDSGAPIYTRAGSNSANAVGMLIAAAGNGTIGYGEHISTIEQHLGVTLLTWS